MEPGANRERHRGGLSRPHARIDAAHGNHTGDEVTRQPDERSRLGGHNVVTLYYLDPVGAPDSEPFPARGGGRGFRSPSQLGNHFVYIHFRPQSLERESDNCTA